MRRGRHTSVAILAALIAAAVPGAAHASFPGTTADNTVFAVQGVFVP